MVVDEARLIQDNGRGTVDQQRRREVVPAERRWGVKGRGVGGGEGGERRRERGVID